MLDLLKAAIKRNHPFVFESALLPRVQLNTHNAITQLDQTKIRQYHKIVNWHDTPENAVHPCYLHMFAFQQHMQLMLDQKFPFALLGIVHLSNYIKVNSPLTMDIVEGTSGLEIDSQVINFKRHLKGMTFAIETKVSHQNNVIWQSESEMLAINKKVKSSKSNTLPFTLNENMQLVEQWYCPNDIGRKYSKVSRDFNPIHLSELSAKLFGFKSAIAHGMWSKARSLSALHSGMPKILSEAFSCLVNFNKPLFLPTEVALYKHQQTNSIKMELVSSNAKIRHLSGEILF